MIKRYLEFIKESLTTLYTLPEIELKELFLNLNDDGINTNIERGFIDDYGRYHRTMKVDENIYTGYYIILTSEGVIPNSFINELLFIMDIIEENSTGFEFYIQETKLNIEDIGINKNLFVNKKNRDDSKSLYLLIRQSYTRFNIDDLLKYYKMTNYIEENDKFYIEVPSKRVANVILDNSEYYEYIGDPDKVRKRYSGNYGDILGDLTEENLSLLKKKIFEYDGSDMNTNNPIYKEVLKIATEFEIEEVMSEKTRIIMDHVDDELKSLHKFEYVYRDEESFYKIEIDKEWFDNLSERLLTHSDVSDILIRNYLTQFMFKELRLSNDIYIDLEYLNEIIEEYLNDKEI